MTLSRSIEGFVEVPHQADLALNVWSTGLKGLFIQSACGLYGLMGIQWGRERTGPRKIDIREMDSETLLIKFLNELIADIQIHSLAYDEINLDIIRLHLLGSMSGKKIMKREREIKAATFHDLKIERTESGYETTIVFDI